MAVIVPQDIATLLSYFRTGDQPTQDQFEELIRTMFYLYQESVDNAAAAAASAAAVQSLLLDTPVAPVSARINDITNVADLLVGCTVTMDYGGAHKSRVDFTAPFADTNYFALVTSVNGFLGSILEKEVDHVTFQKVGTGTNYIIRIACFPYTRWYDLLQKNALLPAP